MRPVAGFFDQTPELRSAVYPSPARRDDSRRSCVMIPKLCTTAWADFGTRFGAGIAPWRERKRIRANGATKHGLTTVAL